MATVHASFGDIPGEEYAWQRLFDILLHTWDVAVSTGGDTRLPPDLVEAVAGWFDGVEETARKAGAVAESVPVPPDADPRTRLLARCGRRS